MDMKPLILISSGGTGGHMSPASALAQDLKARGFRVELATDQRGLKFTGMFKDVPVHLVHSGTAGAGIKGKIKGGLNLLRGFVQAWKLVRRLKPDVVIGFGGYPSVPAVFIAQIQRIPTIIHEQNAILGLANRILAPMATKIALSLALDKNNHREKSIITGNPIRPEISALNAQEYIAPQDTFRILIMGGSLGATVLSEVVPCALAGLPPENKKRLEIIQQCRAADIDYVQKTYQAEGIKATLVPFIEDVADALSKAHLVIARSGASTVAEVSAAGKPAIFVPYPHHKDQQQKRNAQGLADYGGAWVMTEDFFTPEFLQEMLLDMFKKPHTLVDTAERAKRFGKPFAAKSLGDLVESLVKKR